MKLGQIKQKLKSSIKKHYVRKAEFEALHDEVKRLTKKLAKLEKCCEASNAEKTTPKVVKKAAPKASEKKAETKPAESASDAKAGETQDELTRIKGIGPVLEKKLQSLGIFRFSQIASWSEEDIEKISEHLNFKGRVQREEWVQQAKGLE